MNFSDLWKSGDLKVMHSITYYNEVSKRYGIPKHLFSLYGLSLFRDLDGNIIGVTDDITQVDWESEISNEVLTILFNKPGAIVCFDDVEKYIERGRLDSVLLRCFGLKRKCRE